MYAAGKGPSLVTHQTCIRENAEAFAELPPQQVALEHPIVH